MAYPGPTGADISQVPPHLRQAVIDAANRYNVPLQIVINQGLMESTWGRGPMARPGGGIFQYNQEEQDTLNRAWGTNYNRANPLDNIEMSVRRMSDFARNEGAGRVLRSADGTPYDPGAWFMQRNRDNPIWEIGLGSHIGGMTGYLDLLAGFDTPGSRALGPHSANYVVRGMTGQTPFDQLSSAIQQRFDERVGVGSRPGVDWTGSGGIGSDARVEQQLRQGPGGLLGEAPPWERAGIINPEYGHYLQSQGLMPSNLVPNGGTDFTNTTWNAPAGSQPGWWGPWGAEAVHNWAQEGVTHGYGDPIMNMLGNLNYNLVDPGLPAGPGNAPLGLPPGAATGGVDLAHWIAQQWGTGWGHRGVDPGTQTRRDMDIWDAAPVQQTWEGRPDLTFWDASPGTMTGAPIYVPGGGEMQGPIWQPAGGTWGTPGAITPAAGWAEIQAHGNPSNFFYNPATTTWGTFTGGGGIGHEIDDYNRWYENVIGGVTDRPGPNEFREFGLVPEGTFDVNSLGSTYPMVNQLWTWLGGPTAYATVGQQIHDTTEALRNNIPSGWGQTSTGNLSPPPMHFPTTPGPTPGNGLPSDWYIPPGFSATWGTGGAMMAQPGASATGSMGGSHDQPAADQAGQPPPMGSIAAGAPPPEWLEQFKKQQQGFGRGMGALFAQY
jgi:hypothetical protein